MISMSDTAIVDGDVAHDIMCRHYMGNVPGYCRECHWVDVIRADERRKMAERAVAEYQQGRDDAADALDAFYDVHDRHCEEPRCGGPDREFAVEVARGTYEEEGA